MNLLVVTPLKETFGTKEKIIFAGDWIKSELDFKKKLKNRDYQFYKNTFNQTLKYKEYMIDLRERLISNLVPQLNKIHKLNYTTKIWKILLDSFFISQLRNN